MNLALATSIYSLESLGLGATAMEKHRLRLVEINLVTLVVLVLHTIIGRFLRQLVRRVARATYRLVNVCVRRFFIAPGSWNHALGRLLCNFVPMRPASTRLNAVGLAVKSV